MTFQAHVQAAIEFAIRAHEGQFRKGQPQMPYVVHPLHVGFLLTRYGLADEVVMGGILHDVIEDCEVTREDLASRFGAVVAALVDEVSEVKELSWEDRKRHTIDSIATMSAGARAIVAADKVHNLGDMVDQLARQGDDLWGVFRRGKGPTMEYYRRVSEELTRHFPHPLSEALVDLVRQVPA